MNVSSAILGLLNKVKDSTLSHFEVLDTFIYDEGLDFRGRASQWLSKQGMFVNYEGEIPKDWVFIIWNRSSLQPSNYNNRPMSVTANSQDLSSAVNADSKTNMRMASLDIELKIVTNNIKIAELIEEHLYVNTGEFLVFTADYGDIGQVTCSSQPETTTTFEKEDLNELGPVIAVGTTININFPVIMPIEMVSRIEEIDYKLYGGVKIPSENILDEKIIS